MSKIPVILLVFVPVSVLSTPSVWSCPFMNPMMMMPGMAVGEDCPTDSFVHYYSCCDDNPFQCCFHFETWAIVIFGIIGLFIIVSSLFIAGKLLMAPNSSKNVQNGRV
ncbi:DUF2650 domain-containing protein [Caenorhabditis elegans]|uniref:Uncharacterized protein n=1 Tax=Caenorhabditis elegans TaxID=6239 RepID=C7IVR8_CAEEL|nr:Uncharacterized protein CELE_H05C05.4 [Caenorhabditis elegans]CCD72194.2 Uncharacterized protein CELE_H05C05.4 [Caenorhabditis elegans]|eukprot:NP_001254860.1 Uncharacterized protein CELE_H05C05.4 [Caenorhabditis elegans]